MSGTGEEKRETEFNSTMEALRRAESTLPDFTSSYDDEIRRLYEEIVTRPAFRYDPLNDPLYQNYRTQAVTTTATPRVWANSSMTTICSAWAR